MKFRVICLLAVLTAVCLMDNSAFGQKRRTARAKVAVTKTSSSFSRNLTAAAASLEKRNFETALNFANKAIMLKPDSSQGYIYAINAYVGLEDFSNALATGEKAKQACSQESLSELEVLLAQVAIEKTQLERIRAAEAFAREGNAEMAAQTYKEAWASDSSREDLGLKAATIFNDNAKNYDEAIAILRKLVLNTKDPNVSADAKDLLQIAEDNRQAREAELARQRDEEARREAGERERQRLLQIEREKEAARQQIESQIGELEKEREDLSSKLNRAESSADYEDGQVDYWERQMAAYDTSTPAGQFGAGMSKIGRDRAKRKADSYRQEARSLQREIGEIERKISALERKLR